MKALSIRQPWASMIAQGEKTIETRTWRASYRGPLLICASKRPAGHGPTGVALAIADLVACEPMTRQHERDACCATYEGAYAWILANVAAIEAPFPVRGQLGLFDVELPHDVEERAAIIEYDGGETRGVAERLAVAGRVDHQRAQHGPSPERAVCERRTAETASGARFFV